MKSEYNRRLCHNIKILMKLMSRVIYQHLLSNESVIQSLSCVQLCDPMNFSTPIFPLLHYLPEFIKLMSIESVMPSNHLILCRPLLLLPSIFPSIRVFSNESAFRIRWPKYWCFSFSITLSNVSGLISFRIDLQPKGLSGVFSDIFYQMRIKYPLIRWEYTTSICIRTRFVNYQQSKGFLQQYPLFVVSILPFFSPKNLNQKYEIFCQTQEAVTT